MFHEELWRSRSTLHDQSRTLNSVKKGLGPNVIHSVVFFIYFCLVRFGRIFYFFKEAVDVRRACIRVLPLPQKD